MEAGGHLLDDITRRIAAQGTRGPVSKMLEPIRRRAADAAIDRHQARGAKLAAALLEGDGDARAELARLAERALAEMRSEVEHAAARAGTRRAWAALMDTWWRQTDSGEYLDDPDLDRDMRVRILAHLDAVNDLLDSYRAFFTEMEPMLCRDRPTRVLDLAAGHGGFALAAARIAHVRGYKLSLVASDIKREYLDLGEARAVEQRLDVGFVVQDALDLSNLTPGEYDILTCTQSIHHFAPGQVAVMFAEAARIAARGVLFVDGARSSMAAMGLAALGLLKYRDTAFVHDAVISFRRFFVPEELGVLARIGPWGAQARASWVKPGHCLLSLARAA